MWNEIRDFAAPELAVYARASEVQLYCGESQGN